MRRTRPRREPTARELELTQILSEAVGTAFEAGHIVPDEERAESVAWVYARARRRFLRAFRRSSYRKSEGP